MSDPTCTKTPFEIKYILARSFFYSFIADLFRHPSGEEVQNRVAQSLTVWPEALDAFPKERHSALRTILGKLSKKLENLDDTEWIGEFDRFFGHTAFGAFPPYEIEYGEEHSHRQPQELADIAAFYNAFGLRLSQNAHERVDHVSVECEFMSFLLHKEAYARERSDDQNADLCCNSAKRFFAEHLGCWVPSFAHKLLRHKSSGLLRDVAEFTLLFITEESQIQEVTGIFRDMPLRRVDEGQETGCVSCSLKVKTS